MERGGPDGLAGAHGDGCLSWRCGPGRGCTVGSCVDFPRAERYELSAATADVINERRRAGGCVMVCGTSALRTMETVADDAGLLWRNRASRS